MAEFGVDVVVGVLVKDEVFLLKAPPGVAEIRKGPHHQGIRGCEDIGMAGARGKPRHRDAARSHDGENPDGAREVGFAAVLHPMDDFHSGTGLVHADRHLFAQAGFGFDGGRQGKDVARKFHFHGEIVGRVAHLAIFGRKPDTVAAPELPGWLAGFAETLFVNFEDVAAANKAEAHDAGADIGSDDEFYFAIRDPVAVWPTTPGDLFDLNRHVRGHYFIGVSAEAKWSYASEGRGLPQWVSMAAWPGTITPSWEMGTPAMVAGTVVLGGAVNRSSYSSPPWRP